MMEAQMLFSDEQAVTAAAESTNTHLSSVIRNWGKGNPLHFNVSLTEAMTDIGSNSAMVATLEAADESNFSDAVTLATVTFDALSPAGTQKTAPLQMLATGKKRLRVYYAPTNGNLSTGKFTAAIETEPVGGWTAKTPGDPQID